MRDDVVAQWHAGEVCESKRTYLLEMPDVDFIRPCGVVVAKSVILSQDQLVLNII